ncbi:MAG: hypothetical protein ACRYGP_24295 [Janthinobacterium lividum]
MMERRIPTVAVDANAFDRDGSARDALVDELWAEIAAGRLRLFLPAGVAEEMRHARAPAAVQARAEQVAALALPRERAATPSARQHIDRIRLRAMLRGDGRPGKHDADASHLSEAAEAGCDLFLTRDGKILRKRDILRVTLPPELRIATLEEFMARHRQFKG